jgi:two-component system NtrC family response regulator
MAQTLQFAKSNPGSQDTGPMTSLRVLVVEDDERLRIVIGEWLRADGCEVVTADRGEPAVAQVRKDADFDVVVLDYRLPDIDGFAVLRQLSRLRPELPVVMLTGHASVHHAVEAMKLGAFDYVAKPAELADLSHRVRQAAAAAIARRSGSSARATAVSGGAGDEDPTRGLLGETPAIQQVREMILRLARNANATVLITGESGTGKDVAARALHAASPRVDRPFTNVTCTALPSTLLESELFGHERGAFTDAKTRHRGLFEQSDGGTVFLDEIGDMDLALQGKLLHVLEQKRFRRVGGTEDLVANVRVVAATNVDLPAAVQAGRFRSDLYYRLAVLVLPMPPLRERREDIELLARSFVERFCEEAGERSLNISSELIRKLQMHDWPGNVRELRNVLERAVILASGDTLGPGDIQIAGARFEADSLVTLPPGGVDMKSVERELLVQALERTGGNVTRAAKLLGMNRDQVRYRVQKFGLRDVDGSDEASHQS